ncbi:MAG TPA: hypothetical protein VFR24_12385 [Candidatus Angelobacter sp.]|nr:hypothetical protein [Candidatus Angelobacter sp.]
MALANFDLEELRAKVAQAYRTDDQLLAKFRGYARRLRDGIKPLRTYSVNAVSFVSADGGDNRLAFNPALIELVRVVDSRGNQCVLDALPSSATPAELESRVKDGSSTIVPQLKRLCADLGVNVTALSYLLGGLGQPGKSTGAMRTYRDIIEWAVLYDLVTNPNLQWGGDTILVRDGLLRTKSFKRNIFPKLDQLLRQGIAAHATRNVNLSIVGVAKQSAVLSRLAVALELEAAFHRDYPCYVQVDQDIEEECYNFDRTWLLTYETAEEDENGQKLYQAMGRMFLVKFGDQALDPVWPVDIAEWQIPDAEKILGQLTVDAQQGFPIPDYPMCIQRAHDYAKLTGIEIDVLQDLLVTGMSEKLTPDEVDRLLRLKYLGQSLAALRYKEA